MMWEGKTLTRLRYSGLVRSEEVHVRMYSSSESSPRVSIIGVTSSLRADSATRGSSELFDTNEEVIFDEEPSTERESICVSRNGSLGARARFGTMLSWSFRLGKNGEDWERECVIVASSPSSPLGGVDVRKEGASSNARTYHKDEQMVWNPV